MTDLTYGPKGDPQSTDPFERAQAQAPNGWHVEGQSLFLAGNPDGEWCMSASGPDGQGVPNFISVCRPTQIDAADALVISMRERTA